MHIFICWSLLTLRSATLSLRLDDWLRFYIRFFFACERSSKLPIQFCLIACCPILSDFKKEGSVRNVFYVYTSMTSAFVTNLRDYFCTVNSIPAKWSQWFLNSSWWWWKYEMKKWNDLLIPPVFKLWYV